MPQIHFSSIIFSPGTIIASTVLKMKRTLLAPGWTEQTHRSLQQQQAIRFIMWIFVKKLSVYIVPEGILSTQQTCF